MKPRYLNNFFKRILKSSSGSKVNKSKIAYSMSISYVNKPKIPVKTN